MDEELGRALWAGALQGLSDYESRKRQQRKEARQAAAEERRKAMEEKGVSIGRIVKIVLVIVGAVVAVAGIIMVVRRLIEMRDEQRYADYEGDFEDETEDPDIAAEFSE